MSDLPAAFMNEQDVRALVREAIETASGETGALG